MPRYRAGLSPKERRFVEEYPVDLNGTQAAIRAGYAADSASVTATKKLALARIQGALLAVFAERVKRTTISQDWVIQHLRENVERAMQEHPVLDKKGEPTGQYEYEGSVANRALELLGKHLGMFQDAPALTFNQDNRQISFVVKYETRGDYGETVALPEGKGALE